MRGLTREEYQGLLRSVGTHRGERTLSPYEVARLLRKAELAGESRRGLAEALDVGTTQVATFLKLVSLAADVRELAGWGGGPATVAFSSLAQLSVLKTKDQSTAAKAIIQNGLTWKEVVQLVQLQARSDDSIDASIGKVVALRPEIETRHLYAGVVKSQSLVRTLSRLTQAERDGRLQAVLDSLGLLGATGRLATDRFFISWDENPVVHLHVSPDEFERIIVSRIEEVME